MVELGRKFSIFNRYIMKISKEFWIILGFALLHAAVALGCRLAGLADEMMLTLLTMLLVVLLCLRCRVDGKMTAISVVLVNVIGVLLGRGTALFFGWLFDRLGLGAGRDDLFRHLVICRLYNPGSKRRTAEYVSRYQGIYPGDFKSAQDNYKNNTLLKVVGV